MLESRLIVWLVTHYFSLKYLNQCLQIKTEKISTAFVFMLQEMKDVTKSNWGLGVHLLYYNMWNEDHELSVGLLFNKPWMLNM